MTPVELVTFHERLWGKSAGDTEEAIEEAQRRLGIRLPALLRAIYRETALRHSEMMHVRMLDELAVEDGALLFADEQQGSWSWAIRVEQVENGDPPLVTNLRGPGAWIDDLCSLSEFLRFYALTNRPFVSPFIAQCDYDEAKREQLPWRRVDVRWASIAHSLWTDGEAVLEAAYPNLGARDTPTLERAAATLGIDLEDEEVL